MPSLPGLASPQQKQKQLRAFSSAPVLHALSEVSIDDAAAYSDLEQGTLEREGLTEKLPLCPDRSCVCPQGPLCPALGLSTDPSPPLFSILQP